MAGVELEVDQWMTQVILNRPPLNIVDLALARELVETLEHVRRETKTPLVILAARGRAFCAGVDVGDHLPDRGAEMIRTFDRACTTLLEIEVPVIAAVHGAALGGGAELALVCDLVVATKSSTFGFPEIKLGVFPPVAAALLPGMVPPARAAELVLTGRVLHADEAERIGLVNRVVSDGGLVAAIEDLAGPFSALSPEALKVAKRALRLGRGAPDPRAIAAAEQLYLDQRLNAPDAIEGLKAFMEKRPPSWAKSR